MFNNFTYADPSTTVLSPDGSVFYRANAAPLTVMFDVSVVNEATASDGNNIIALSDPNANFAVEVYLSDMDASAGTLGLQYSPTCSGLSQGVAAAMAETITISCSVDVTFTDANCQQIQFLCVRILEGTDAVYTDASGSNNIICTDITAQKTCTPGGFWEVSKRKTLLLPFLCFVNQAKYVIILFLFAFQTDPVVTGFRDTTTPIFIEGTPISVDIEVDIENQAASGNDILAVTGGDVNYALELVFTDANLQSAADSLGETPVAVTVSSNVQQGLASSAAITLAGSADVILSTTNCPNVQFLCARLRAGSGASYIDSNDGDDSNSRCIDVTSRMQCQTGMSSETQEE